MLGLKPLTLKKKANAEPLRWRGRDDSKEITRFIFFSLFGNQFFGHRLLLTQKRVFCEKKKFPDDEKMKTVVEMKRAIFFFDDMSKLGRSLKQKIIQQCFNYNFFCGTTWN